MDRRTIRLFAAATLALAALAIFAARTRSIAAAAGKGRNVTCELSNPAYSGWCRVTEKLARGVAPAEICAGVLACLNDPRCAKTYCNATTVRGGWKLEAVRSEWKK